MKRFNRIVLIVTFFFVICFPYLSTVLPSLEMSGVFEETEKPELSAKGLMDGSFQSMAEDYFREHIPGRAYMIKTKNQMVFNVFCKSPVEKVIIGKNRQMFSRSFINLWYQLTGPTTDAFIDELSTTIKDFYMLMEQHHINTLIYTTPSKARFYHDDIPDLYRLAAPVNPEASAYDKLMRAVKPIGIPVFDSIAYLESERSGQTLEGYPLFNKTGTHWTQTTGAKVALKLGEYIETTFGYDLPEFSLAVSPVDEPVSPDADIFGILNMYTKAYDTYTEPIFTTTKQGSDLPRLLCRGGSFMGQSLAHLIRQGCFSKDFYMENTQLFEDRFSKVRVFSDYDELDLKTAFENTDLVILEVNEASVDVMDFGFMEYVLEHRDEIFP